MVGPLRLDRTAGQAAVLVGSSVVRAPRRNGVNKCGHIEAVGGARFVSIGPMGLFAQEYGTAEITRTPASNMQKRSVLNK